MTDKEWLTAKDVGALYGHSRPFWSELAKQGLIVAHNDGKGHTTLYQKSSIDAYLANSETVEIKTKGEETVSEADKEISKIEADNRLLDARALNIDKKIILATKQTIFGNVEQFIKEWPEYQAKLDKLQDREADISDSLKEVESQKQMIKKNQNNIKEAARVMVADLERIRDYYNSVLKENPDAKKILAPKLALTEDFYAGATVNAEDWSNFEEEDSDV